MRGPEHDPVTPQDDGQGEGGGGFEGGSGGVERVSGVNNITSGHQTPPSAIRSVCLLGN